MENEKIPFECPHNDAYTKVLYVQGICETTVVVCCECETHLTVPKVEC